MGEKLKKNPPGGWVGAQYRTRVLWAAMLCFSFGGFLFGFIVRGFFVVDEVAGESPWWAVGSVTDLAVLSVGGGVLVCFVYVYMSWLDRTWLRGFEAERRIGALIEYGVTHSDCAVGHDVKELLPGGGNVDHVVMTPAGVWVVETKANWVSKRRFPLVLRQVAENATRVRRYLDTSMPVRGALVIAAHDSDSLEKQYDWKGEEVLVFGGECFARELRGELKGACAGVGDAELARVREAVWKLGSSPL